MAEDFSKAPISVAEARAYKKQDSNLLSPRDCLIRTLREIDSGELNVEGLILVMKAKDVKDGEFLTHTRTASMERSEACGRLHIAANIITGFD